MAEKYLNSDESKIKLLEVFNSVYKIVNNLPENATFEEIDVEMNYKKVAENKIMKKAIFFSSLNVAYIAAPTRAETGSARALV